MNLLFPGRKGIKTSSETEICLDCVDNNLPINL